MYTATLATAPVQGRRPLTAKLTTMLAALLVAVGMITVAQPASAYTYAGSGAYYVASISPMYVNSAGPAFPAYRQLSSPTVSVRSPFQTTTTKYLWVDAQSTLQRYNSTTRSWTTYAVDTSSAIVPSGQTTQLVGHNLGRWTRGYYYRVVVVVRFYTYQVIPTGEVDYFGNSITTDVSTETGRVQFTPSHTADQVCTAAYCTSYAGSVLVN